MLFLKRWQWIRDVWWICSAQNKATGSRMLIGSVSVLKLSPLSSMFCCRLSKISYRVTMFVWSALLKKKLLGAVYWSASSVFLRPKWCSLRAMVCPATLLSFKTSKRPTTFWLVCYALQNILSRSEWPAFFSVSPLSNICFVQYDDLLGNLALPQIYQSHVQCLGGLSSSLKIT
jgi:hypothetical protein